MNDSYTPIQPPGRIGPHGYASSRKGAERPKPARL